MTLDFFCNVEIRAASSSFVDPLRIRIVSFAFDIEEEGGALPQNRLDADLTALQFQQFSRYEETKPTPAVGAVSLFQKWYEWKRTRILLVLSVSSLGKCGG